MSTSLAGHAALVTGAGGMIGQAIVPALAGHGARTVLAGRQRESLERVRASIDEKARASCSLLSIHSQCSILSQIVCRVMHTNHRATHLHS